MSSEEVKMWVRVASVWLWCFGLCFRIPAFKT